MSTQTNYMLDTLSLYERTATDNLKKVAELKKLLNVHPIGSGTFDRINEMINLVHVNTQYMRILIAGVEDRSLAVGVA